MHQSVKLTDAIWLLQLVISSPLIHALDDPSQAPTGIRIQSPEIERQKTYQLSYIFPLNSKVITFCLFISLKKLKSNLRPATAFNFDEIIVIIWNCWQMIDY